MKLKNLIETDSGKSNNLLNMSSLMKYFKNKGFSEEEAKDKAERAMAKFETMIGNMAAFKKGKLDKK